VLLPSRLEAFAVTPTGAGLILGINRYIRVVSNSWAGWMYQRLGFYRPFTLAVILAAGTTMSYGLATGFWGLFIAHGIWGIAWSLLRLGGYLTVIDARDGANVGRFMGVLESVSRSGSLVAVVLGGILADRIGGREVFIVYGFVTLSAFALLPLCHVQSQLGRHSSTPGPHQSEGESQQGPPLSTSSPSNPLSGTPPVKNLPRRWSQPEGRRHIQAIYFEAAIVRFTVAGLLISTAGYLVRTLAGEGAILMGFALGVGTLSGALVSISWIGDLVLSPLFGHVSDRKGRGVVIGTAMTIAILAMLAVAANPTLVVAIPSFAIVFLAGSALQVALNASIADFAAPEHRTSILSRYATWADVGSGTGPIVALPMATMLGFGWAYGLGVVLMCMALVIHLTIFRRRS
jgi:MFS family permease